MTERVAERLASLETLIKAEKEYQHQRWHKFDNDLQPLFLLPERMLREIDGLKGSIRGEISAAVRDVEKTFSLTIAPMLEDIEKLQTEVKELQAARATVNTWSALLQSPIISAIIGGIVTAFAIILAYFKGVK